MGYANYIDAEMKKTALTVLVVLLFLETVGTRFTSLGIAQTSEDLDAGDVLAASPHSILIESPNNYTIYRDSLNLNITVDFLKTDGLIFWQTLTSLNYSIDDETPVNTITNEASLDPPINSNNVTVSGLTDGQHKIEVTAVFVGNIGNTFLPTYTFTSAPVYFTVNTESQLEPFPATLIFVASIGIALAVIGLFVYFKKLKRNRNS